MTPLMMYAKLC